MKLPKLTKPAGVFVQALSIIVLLVGLGAAINNLIPGVLVALVGAFGVYWGRQSALGKS